jgi:hypothetical protein
MLVMSWTVAVIGFFLGASVFFFVADLGSLDGARRRFVNLFGMAEGYEGCDWCIWPLVLSGCLDC